MAIPFEALDVRFKNAIDLNLTNIYNKVVLQKRGGYCYELNFLFHSLLAQIGFESSLVSSRIYDNKNYGPEFDHMSIVVRLQELWLVDVGYGDLIIEPLKIAPQVIQEDYFKIYKIEEIDENKYLLTESLKGKANFTKK